MVSRFRGCMDGHMFESVYDWSCVSECAWMVLCFRGCVNGFVFQRVHEWSCVSECA